MKIRLGTALIAAIVFMLIGAIGSDIYFRKNKAKYLAKIDELVVTVDLKDKANEEIRRLAEAQIAELRGMIDSSATIISGYEEDIQALQAQNDAQNSTIHELLTAEVQELIDRYPALKSYTLALNNLIGTKDQIILTLNGRDNERVKIIEAQERQILLERGIASSWKKQFEDQRALRIAVELTFDHYRQATLRSKLLWTAGALAAGFLGGAVSR